MSKQDNCKHELTAEELRRLLKYDPSSGRWFYRENVAPRARADDETAIALDNLGYRNITIASQHYKAHRLTWLYMTGKFPKDEIDMIDGDRANCRFENLREANRQQNCRNRRKVENKTGHRGVWCLRGRYAASIRGEDGKRRLLGVYDTPAEPSPIWLCGFTAEAVASELLVSET